MILGLLVLIQIAIFASLIVVLRHLLKRHVGTASSHIEALTQDATQKLVEAKKRLDEANAYYSDILAKSKEEGGRLKQQLIEEGLKAKQEMLDQVRKQGQEIVERAQTAATLLKERLDQEINEEARKRTLQLVQQLLAGKMSEETHAHWVNELVKSGFDGLNRLHVPDDIKEIEVVSAFPLKPAQKTMLSEQLKRRFGREVALKEKVNPELILGIRLTVGNVVVDGTLAHRAKEVLTHASFASG
ncbi:MAG: F0F1 ATP synthase subunit delta [Candidatus Omnitrophica bacterium]|nr:F0F1 ATP synthase subunit delta [Candidatus Omnitrophota bacterium]